MCLESIPSAKKLNVDAVTGKQEEQDLKLLVLLSCGGLPDHKLIAGVNGYLKVSNSTISFSPGIWKHSYKIS